MEGEILTFTVASAADLEREVFHHTLTNIEIVEVGLSFESERTANMEMPLSSLLGLMTQDIRDNAQQVNAESDDRSDTEAGLAKFFERVDQLSTEFPWTLKLTCPMCLARIEELEDGEIPRVKYLIADEDAERVSAAFADLAFDAADQADEANE